MLLLLLFIFFTRPVFAQNSADLYTQYRTDYLYQRDLYQKDYLDYLNKKDTFAQYGSITAQNDKNSAAKNVLLTQNSMLKAYLMTLRVTLNDSPNLQNELQKWENWLSTQNQLIPNLNSSADIKNWTNTFNSQYIPIQTQIYTGLVQGQINRRLKTLDSIKNLAKSANIDWTSNFSDKETKIKEGFESALKSTEQEQRDNHFSDFYPEAKESLDIADNYLKSLITDLKSTLIKNSQ